MFTEGSEKDNNSARGSTRRRTVLSVIGGGGLLRAMSRRSHAQSEDYANAWYRPLSGTPTQAVTYGDIIYVGDEGGNVFGYDIRSGDPRFQVSVDGQIPKHGISVTDSAVVIALESGEIRFFDPDNQNLQERFGLGGTPSGMTKVGRSIYVFDQSGILSKFDTSVPTPTWQEEIWSDNIPNSQTLIATENRIIIKGNGSNILLVDPNNGEVIRKITSAGNYQGAFGGWTGTISNDETTACILETFRSSAAYIIDLQSGTVRQFEYANSGTSTCGPAGGMFFVGGGDQIRAIEQSTGAVNWQMDFTTTDLSLDVFEEQLIAVGRTGGKGLLRAVDSRTSAINWDVELSDTEDLINSGINQYTFTKPVRVDGYYGVTGSAGDDNWIASFGPKSKSTPTSSPSSSSTARTTDTAESRTPPPTTRPNNNSLNLLILFFTALGAIGTLVAAWINRKQLREMVENDR